MATEKSTPKPVIACRPNGPLLVKGLKTLRDAKGAAIETADTIALCRCGASAKKPFCDGTHKRIGFSGEKSPDRTPDRRESFAGQRLAIHDNRGICSHAGICTERLTAVWRMSTEPWIDPDGADAASIVEVIEACPSGALSYTLDGDEPEQMPRDPAIEIEGGGPYRVTGGIELADTEFGAGASREKFALCRCGASMNKPFCDGSHWNVKFDAPEAGEAGEITAKKSEAAETVTVTRNRAWRLVAGPDELADGEVRTVEAGGGTIALSRVGTRYGAIDNACPHQGGPLGDGTIEDGCLRCPWHGWDFDPLTGEGRGADGASVEAFEVEARADGIYVAVPEAAARARTISDVMVETMTNWGVSHVFGMVGHSNLGLADAVRLREEAGDLNFIGVRHEGAAAFAASGFAKVSGRPAACLTIAGPGATNLLTGLWDAKMDRAPVLALTGQVNTQVLGPGAFQEIDQSSAFEAVASWSQTVLPDSRHAELMSLALKHATVKREVAHLIFPDEVQALAAAAEAAPSGPEGRLGETDIAPSEASLAKALALIAGAKRPAIVCGFGAREDMDAVTALAERLGCPVLTTFKAKGQIADDHPLAAGVLGRSGTPIAASAMSEADLLIVFGASFAVHTGIDRDKPIVQVDFDQMALAKFHAVAAPVWGDIGVTARRLIERLPKTVAPTDQRADLAERWRQWREEKARRAAEDKGNGIAGAALFAALSRQAPEDAVIAVDVGNNTYSFGRYFECRRQTVIMSGYLGSIGFGFPAAMGAWAAAPGRPILSVSGDGGFAQYMAEFTTAVKYGMNITHVLLNNAELGKISKEQRDGGWPVWQTELVNPDFAKFAQNCGGYGVRVMRPDGLDGALAEAIAHKGPALVEIASDAELV